MGDFFLKSDGSRFKKPNLNAPRERKNNYKVLSLNLFKRFKEKYPDSTLSWKQFKLIISVGNTIYSEKVISNREGVDLPNMLGKLFIGSCQKKKGANYDFTTSGEIDTPVNHKNFESNRYLCKIFYTNFDTKYQLRLRKYWYFNAARSFKREVSKAYRENWNHYIKISPFQKISSQARREGIKSIKISKYERKGGRIDFSNTQPD